MNGSINQPSATLQKPKARKFVIDISQRDQDDLKLRLGLARFPDQLNSAGWEYGTELHYLQVKVFTCLCPRNGQFSSLFCCEHPAMRPAVWYFFFSG